MNSSELYSKRLDLTKKYWDYLGTSCQFFDAEDKIIEVYMATIERDLFMIQMSMLSNLQFEIDHGIATTLDMLDKMSTIKQISSDLYNFNALKTA